MIRYDELGAALFLDFDLRGIYIAIFLFYAQILNIFALNRFDMETVVIEVKTKADIKFWLDLAHKTGTNAKAFDTEEIEDKQLARLIEKGMKTATVSREKVMKALGR
jgi:hypothetical protein